MKGSSLTSAPGRFAASLGLAFLIGLIALPQGGCVGGPPAEPGGEGSRGEEGAADTTASPPKARITSPSTGRVVRDDLIPLTAWTPEVMPEAVVSARLDGVDITDPVGIYRRRWSRGGGADYLSVLDLSALKPGPHSLSLTFLAPSAKGTSLPDRREMESVFEYAPHPCRVDLRLVDGGGLSRGGRVLVYDGLTGAPVNLWGEDVAADPSKRDVVGYTVLLPEGAGHVRLPPGRYTFVGLGGVRDGVDLETVQVSGGESLTFTVPVEVETPGRVTADLHVHSGRSTDAFIPDRWRMESLIGADVKVAVLSDHNKVTDSATPLGLLDLGDELALIPGVEARVARGNPGVEDPDEGGEEEAEEAESGKEKKRAKNMAHVNAFPVVGPEAGGPALPDQVTDSLRANLAAWRERQVAAPFPGVGATVLLQLNHPRGIQFYPEKGVSRVHDLFDKVDLLPGLPLGQHAAGWLNEPAIGGAADVLDFDAMEVMNRFSARAWWEVRADWFSLLNQGIFITGTGNSDSHSVHVEQVGYPVNLVHLPPPEPGAVGLDVGAFVEAIAAGRVEVSNGPVVGLRVQTERGEGGVGDLVAGRHLRVTATVDAARWVPVPEVRLVVNGEVLDTLTLSPAADPDWPNVRQETHRGTFTWELDLDRDGWLLVEAGWPLQRWKDRLPGLYGRISPGSVPVGFTNPVRLDVNGDGRWTVEPPRVTRGPMPTPAPADRAPPARP